MSAPAAPEAGAVPTTENCRFCWMCRHACPVGHVTHRETYTPHAWALEIESVRRGQIVWDASTVSVLYACADCGLCRAHCATDQPLPDAIVAERAAITAAGAAPAAVYDVERRLRRHVESGAAARSSNGPRRASSTVGLFVGDISDAARARAVESTIALLAAAGVPVTEVGADRPTGRTAASLGLRDVAVDLARAVIDDVQSAGIDELLVLAPGDRWAFESVYADRLGLEWPKGVRVTDAIVVLARALAAGALSFGAPKDLPPYAYHDPCHTPRLARDYAAPRALAAAALGPDAARPFFWREHRAHPCGAIGGLNVTHPDIAARLAAARVDDARAAGARWIVTEDPACSAHLAAHASGGVEVRNLFELLHERLVTSSRPTSGR
ncbi:MAG TPA: (Fe-S)-binding protein [Vicinamibacterales bacterium]|jgi:Fe-S oxidoreductase|nr:(Fe-S)-binding protein [Vicinamibacterales bacterium]